MGFMAVSMVFSLMRGSLRLRKWTAGATHRRSQGNPFQEAGVAVRDSAMTRSAGQGGARVVLHQPRSGKYSSTAVPRARPLSRRRSIGRCRTVRPSPAGSCGGVVRTAYRRGMVISGSWRLPERPTRARRSRKRACQKSGVDLSPPGQAGTSRAFSRARPLIAWGLERRGHTSIGPMRVRVSAGIPGRHIFRAPAANTFAEGAIDPQPVTHIATLGVAAGLVVGTSAAHALRDRKQISGHRHG